MKIKCILGLLLLGFILTGVRPMLQAQSFINLSHLNHLYDRLKVANGDTLSVIYIYSEFPDYRPVEAKGEGVACVDDMTRAAVAYLHYGLNYQDKQALARSRALIRSILKFQAANGCFYNFLRKDGKIEKQNRNSRPLADWWTWRAFWALAEYGFYRAHDEPVLAGQIKKAVYRILPNVKNLWAKGMLYEEKAGFRLPLFLPRKYGADQASVLLKALSKMYQWTKDSLLLPLMNPLAQGIMAMQIRDVQSAANGLFLSWQNYWHAYGNSQADALLDYFSLTGDSSALSAALYEIDTFYPYLMKIGYLRSLTLRCQGQRVFVEKRLRFEQIAYDFRPMIWACLHAYRVTGKKKYARQAALLAGWFFGMNSAKAVMYQAQTGRCFDGIVSAHSVNRNAGAESTIEALLSLMAVEQNPVSRRVLNRLIPETK